MLSNFNVVFIAVDENEISNKEEKGKTEEEMVGWT